MARNVKDEIVQKANSAQVLLDYLSSEKENFNKPFNPNLALTLLREDPLVRGSIKRITAKTMEGGWHLNFEDKDRKRRETKRFKKDYRFTKLLRTLINTLQYQDVLIEIVRKDGKVIDLNLLDPKAIEVKAKPNGDIEYWFQEEVKSVGKGVIKWKPENVVHVTYEEAILNVWGENQLKAAYDTLLIKDYVRAYLLWLFKTNQFRTHFNVKNASEPQIRAFISRLKQGESSYSKPVITEGEVEASPLRELKDLDTIEWLLDWCDKQLIGLLGQTVVGLGMGGSGGRSESDSLGDTLRTTIIDIQNIIGEAFNYELLPKMGYPVEEIFAFNPLDRMTKKQLMETIEIMRRSGWKDEAIKEFAEEQGLEFKVDSWFQPPEMQNAMTAQARKDGAASRQRSSEGEADKNVGTGQESSTREDQLVQKASFEGYPYSYEVID